MGKKEPLPPGTTRIDGTDGSLTFDGRQLTIRHNWMADSGSGESTFPVSAVVGVEVKNGLMLASVTVRIGSETVRWGQEQGQEEAGQPWVVNGFQKQEAVLFRDMLLNARAAYYEGTSPGLVEQIRQLAAFHAQGVLSDAEFAAAKARLLNTGEPQDERPPRW